MKPSWLRTTIELTGYLHVTCIININELCDAMISN